MSSAVLNRLDRRLHEAVERATAEQSGPDEHRQAIAAVFGRALACVRAAHGLAARGESHRVASRRDFRRGLGAETPLYWTYCKFRRHRPRRKDQARRRDDFHHGLLGEGGSDGSLEIDWASVSVDALADAYESLLEGGGELVGERPRKRSGTYYTPAELVDRLLDEALEPILDRACSRPDPAAALLELRVCDPACGSGRFVLAAARRMAARLVAIGDHDARGALATVVERCVYGVDVDPIAIELCRLSLQLETGLTRDRLRCGDALLGAPVERASSWASADAWCVDVVRPVHAEGSQDPGLGRALIDQYRFFHWSLAFPEVWARGGFDAVVGNPPWEMLEQPGDRRSARREGAMRLIAASGRFPLGSSVRKNLYALFVELGERLCNPGGRLAMIVPTELVQGAIAERLARPWFEQRRCAAVFDFQNRPAGGASRQDKWFPAVHPQLRFSLLCLAPDSDAPKLCADAATLADTRDPKRVYRHDAAAILRMCHGSFRLPLFRGPVDRRIHERAYARGRPLGELLAESGVIARLLFNFGPSEKQAKLDHFAPGHLRVYEGEHIHQFNHRYATRSGERTIRVAPEQLGDPEFAIATAAYLPIELVHARLRALVSDGTVPEYLLVLRRQARAADAHVGIAAIIPTAATEGSLTCFLTRSGPEAALLCASFNSYAFNYLLASRQTGPNVNKGVLAELPIIDRRAAEHPHFDLAWIARRVVELSYCNAELEPFARACGQLGPPSRWSAPHRAQRRYELEAAMFHHYGFTPETAAHALDRFTIVARREQSAHGEFRSKREILEQLTAMQTADPNSR